MQCLQTNKLALAAAFFRFLEFRLLHNVHCPFSHPRLWISLRYLCKWSFYEILCMRVHIRAKHKIKTNQTLAAVFFRLFQFCSLHNVHRQFLHHRLWISLQKLCKWIFYAFLKARGVQYLQTCEIGTNRAHEAAVFWIFIFRFLQKVHWIFSRLSWKFYCSIFVNGFAMKFEQR